MITENVWFAAQPSSTKDAAKVFAESFKREGHPKEVSEAAMASVEKTRG